MTKSLLRPVLIVAALLATMLPAQVTWAQGTRGLVPDPITSQELGQMADRLELSAAQRELLDALHQAYLLDYRALRSDEIESLLQTTTDLNPWRLMSIDTKELRDSVRSIGQVLNSVRALDTALFDQLTPNLSEAQTEQLLGVMQMRERQRLRTGATQLIGRGNPAAGVDLGVLYRELDLSPAERDATEPMVIAYEQSLTAAVRRLHQASNRMATDLIKKLDEQQAAGAESREQGFQMFQTLLAALDESSESSRKQANEIATLNARTLRELNGLLTVESAEALRGRYLDRAYGDSPRARRATTAYREVLRFDDLPAHARDEIGAAAFGFHERRNRLVNEAIEVIDASRGGAGDLGRFFGEGRREFRRTMDEFRERMRSLEETEIESLRGLLAPPFADRLDIMLAATAPREEQQASRGGGRRGGGRPGDGGRGNRGGSNENDRERFVPSPLTRGTAMTYATRLGLTEDETIVAEVLHADYVDAWGQVYEGDLKAVREGRAEIERSMHGDGDPATVNEIKALYAGQQRVIDALLALDKAFFSDLEALVTRNDQKAAIHGLVLTRTRAVYGADLVEYDAGPGHYGGWSPGESREPAVDVWTLVDDLGLDPQTLADAKASLADYEAHAVDAFRRRYELAKEQELAAAIAFAEGAESGGRGGRGGRWRRLGELRQDQRGAMTAVTDPIVAMNRATVDTLADALGDDAGRALRSAYDRAAFPQAYDVKNAAERYLTAALELPDLGDNQRSGVTEIMYEYGPAYEGACQQLVQLFRTPPSSGGDNGWQNWRERRSRVEVLEFDRDQVNARALRQLRNVLDEDQRTRAGMVDETNASERE